MMRSFALSVVITGVLAAPVAGQPRGTVPAHYDPAAEVTYGGVITAVVSVTSADGTVGVHLNLKPATGVVVKVHLGPAMFIGMNNFSFFAEEQVLVTGSMVLHGGETALWAREITKAGKTLTLRSTDGTPRWPYATADDPDGCGISHEVVRY
jgi:hypothetical protein